MYFWKTDKLIYDLKHDRLTQENYKNYHLAGAIIAFWRLAVAAINIKHNLNVLVELVINIGLLIKALNLHFKANGGNQDKFFLNRMLSLALPISIKLTVLYLILGLLIYICIALTYGSAYFNELKTPVLDWIDSIMNLSLVGCIYWCIYAAIKKVGS